MWGKICGDLYGDLYEDLSGNLYGDWEWGMCMRRVRLGR